MLIITAPGQGAQTPGFLAPWLELPGVAERLGAASELAGCDLIRFGTTASADEIKDTAVAQPLLVAAAIVAAAALSDPALPGGVPAEAPADAAAGHSVGELAAGVIGGVLTADDAMRLVAVRGRAMAAAAATEPTGMTAVLGGDQEAVLATIARHGLTPANVNGAGQIVAAGTLAELEAFAADPPGGTRLRPLQVAGAFHTRHMAPAVAALRDAAADVTVTDPALTLLSDADGAAVTTGKEWLERIVAQVAAPVRWDLCMQTMADLGVTALIELPPAGTLTGLARRTLPGVTQLAIKTPEQLDAARDLIAEHLAEPDAHAHDHLPEWRLIVAPASGTFRSPPVRRSRGERDRHGLRGRGQGAGRQRPVSRRHRPGHRGHLQHRGVDTERLRGGRAPARHRLARRLRPQRRLRRLLLRDGQRLRRDPGGHRPARAGHRVGEDDRLGRPHGPVHLHHLRRRGRRRRGRAGRGRRAAGHRPRRLGQRRGHGGEDHHRRPQLVPAAGGPGGVPLDHYDPAPDRGAGLRAGRRRGERAVRVRPAPGEPADHRGHRAQARRTPRARGGRHRACGQHVVGLDPAGPVPDGRARGGQIGITGPAARVRRGDVLRGAGDHGTLAAPSPPLDTADPAPGPQTFTNT